MNEEQICFDDFVSFYTFFGVLIGSFTSIKKTWEIFDSLANFQAFWGICFGSFGKLRSASVLKLCTQKTLRESTIAYLQKIHQHKLNGFARQQRHLRSLWTLIFNKKCFRLLYWRLFFIHSDTTKSVEVFKLLGRHWNFFRGLVISRPDLQTKIAKRMFIGFLCVRKHFWPSVYKFFVIGLCT